MNTLEITEIIGTIAFTLSGFMVATKDRLDLLGIIIASFVTALGGGIIRDAIADRVPYAFTNFLPTILVLSVILISVIFRFHNKDHIVNNIYFVISDSIGLVSFSITGALVGIIASFNIFGVIILAFITAAGGGILRDTLLNRVPQVLISELYGTVAIIVGIVIGVLNHYDKVTDFTILIVFCLGLTLRLVAYNRKWHLPQLR